MAEMSNNLFVYSLHWWKEQDSHSTCARMFSQDLACYPYKNFFASVSSHIIGFVFFCVGFL